MTTTDAAQVLDEVIRSHGGAGALSAVDMAIARSLAQLLAAPDTELSAGQIVTRAEAIAKLKAMLPVPRSGRPWDLSKLDDSELDALERMAMKAQGIGESEVEPPSPSPTVPPAVPAHIERELENLRIENAGLRCRLDAAEAALAQAAPQKAAGASTADPVPGQPADPKTNPVPAAGRGGAVPKPAAVTKPAPVEPAFTIARVDPPYAPASRSPDWCEPRRNQFDIPGDF